MPSPHSALLHSGPTFSFTLFGNESDVCTFSASQFIFPEGQPDDDLMYAVQNGGVDIVWQQHLLETIPLGGVFGEMALRSRFSLR